MEREYPFSAFRPLVCEDVLLGVSSNSCDHPLSMTKQKDGTILWILDYLF